MAYIYTGKDNANAVKIWSSASLDSGNGATCSVAYSSPFAAGSVKFLAETSTGGGGGGESHAPWTETVDGGGNLSYGAVNTTGVAGRFLSLQAQSTATAHVGGYVEAYGGYGSSGSGGFAWGNKNSSFVKVKLGELANGAISLFQDGTTANLSARMLSAAGNPFTVQRLRASATQYMEFNLTSASGDGDGANLSFFSYAFFKQSIGSTNEAFRISYDGTLLRGSFEQREASAPATPLLRVLVSNQTLTTAAVTATLIASYAVNVNEAVTVTSTMQHDNGTTNGRTVFTHTFRRGAGAATATGSAEDGSFSAKKLAHGQTIALNGNTIEVKIVAAAVTSTKHRGQVSFEIASIV